MTNNTNIVRFRQGGEIGQFLKSLPNRSQWIKNSVKLTYELEQKYQNNLTAATFAEFVLNACEFYRWVSTHKMENK